MKISSRDKKILIVFIGMIAAVLSYFLVFNPTLEDNEKLEAENARLNTRLADLRSKAAREEEYRSETERMNLEVEQILSDFPSYLQTENGIMDVVEIENKTGAQVPSVTIADPVLIEISATAEASADNAAASATDTAADSADAQTEVTASAASQYYLYDVNTNLSYTSTYAGMKQIIDLIAKDEDKRSVSTFSATFDNTTGEITGAVSYESYFIFGQDKDYEPADIPSINHGTENIFGSVDVAPVTESKDSGSEDED